MVNIVFVCTGNVCRSPMAEAIFKYLADQENLSSGFKIASRGILYETQGTETDKRAQEELVRHGIPAIVHKARVFTIADYIDNDYIIAMEYSNVVSLKRIIQHPKLNKVSMLLDYTKEKGNIEDPMYTEDFKKAFDDIFRGVKGFISFLKERI